MPNSARPELVGLLLVLFGVLAVGSAQSDMQIARDALQQEHIEPKELRTFRTSPDLLWISAIEDYQAFVIKHAPDRTEFLFDLSDFQGSSDVSYRIGGVYVSEVVQTDLDEDGYPEILFHLEAMTARQANRLILVDTSTESALALVTVLPHPPDVPAGEFSPATPSEFLPLPEAHALHEQSEYLVREAHARYNTSSQREPVRVEVIQTAEGSSAQAEQTSNVFVSIPSTPFSQEGISYDVVVNDVYAFVLPFPRSVVERAESASETGAVFTTSDGEVWLVGDGVSDLSLSLEESYRRASAPTTTRRVTYSVLRDHWYVVSGYDANTIFYTKVIQPPCEQEYRVYFDIRFPEHRRQEVEPIVTTVEARFGPYGCASLNQ